MSNAFPVEISGALVPDTSSEEQALFRGSFTDPTPTDEESHIDSSLFTSSQPSTGPSTPIQDPTLEDGDSCMLENDLDICDNVDCLLSCTCTPSDAVELWDQMSPKADELENFEPFVNLRPYAIEEQETEEEPWSQTFGKWKRAELGAVDLESAESLGLVKYRIRVSNKFQARIKELSNFETSKRELFSTEVSSSVYLKEFHRLVTEVANRRRDLANLQRRGEKQELSRRRGLPSFFSKIRRTRSMSAERRKSKSAIEAEMQDYFTATDQLYIKLEVATRRAGSVTMS